MRVLRLNVDTLPDFDHSVITVGAFDGMHLGHQDIILRLCHEAKKVNGPSILITFDPHPRQILDTTDTRIKLLTTLDEKIEILKETALDYLVIIPFTYDFSQLLPEEYIENILIKKFKPHSFIIGYDHTFGINGTGNIDLLKQYHKNGLFNLIEIPKKEIDDIKISSTLVRQSISNNDYKEALNLLGHPFWFNGKVGTGQQLGTKIGFPTANLILNDPDKIIPNPGIYSAIATVEDRRYDGMLYIGNRPTIGDHLKQTIEIHLLDFRENVYSLQLKIEVIEFIRKDQKFDSIDEMIWQIKEDEKQIKKSLTLFHLTEANFKKNPSVAVVILNYNGAHFLNNYLQSIITHTPNYATIYVIDNASTDDSILLLKQKYPEIKRIILHKNYGYAEGYNKGLAQITADYFVLINSDIQVSDDWLSPLIQRIQSDPFNMAVQPKILALNDPQSFEYAGAAGGLMDALGYTFSYGRMLNKVEKDLGQYQKATPIFWASGAAFIINANMFKSIGGFDGDYFAHQEEIDLCWRIQRAGGKIWYEPNSKVYHLGGGTLDYNNPRKLFLNFRNNLATIFKNSSWPILIILLPVRFVIDFLISLKYLLSGNIMLFLKVLEAYIISILSTLYLLHKKDHYNSKIIRSTVNEVKLSGRLKGSLFIHYYLFGNQKSSDIPKHYID